MVRLIREVPNEPDRQDWITPEKFGEIYQFSRSAVYEFLKVKHKNQENKEIPEIRGAEQSKEHGWRIDREVFERHLFENIVTEPKFSKDYSEIYALTAADDCQWPII